MKFDRPISNRSIPSRRTILKASAALLAAGILSPMSSALAQAALGGRKTRSWVHFTPS